VDFERSDVIPIQCKLPEKSGVFLLGHDGTRAEALIDFIDQRGAENGRMNGVNLGLCE
jgi:hypothetical protein